MTLITSTRNPTVKEVLKLQKSSVRKQRQVFVVEGKRELEKARISGYEFLQLFYCSEIAGEGSEYYIKNFPAPEKTEVNAHVYSRLAYRGQQFGILAVGRMKTHSPDTFHPRPNGLYLAVENIEKPGNLGALLRTADAAGLDAVFVCDNQTDIYNPNVIRSSLGCIFTEQVIQASTAECIELFKKEGVQILSAALQDSRLYYESDFRESSVIVLGSEAEGLSEAWRENADGIIRIPMSGVADSLNVSVSAAILVFEAVRQRRMNK